MMITKYSNNYCINNYKKLTTGNDNGDTKFSIGNFAW